MLGFISFFKVDLADCFWVEVTDYEIYAWDDLIDWLFFLLKD